ncbi:D-inositol-3-phosphate glycosyltransferase [Motilibacter rhizosphaerae]|uniref:D-inositol-3-phosphate glycosyltransferase n=1 Tax=Motilibacter rhizosphaerae TaxID=598652 RepID=A0A4Q7NR12_9ACTN|nr:D-inositol-3-phosphate glycosyltransferase [Motilibacter rhizosphaerae]RZS87612.1 D-inositol-3-phosphate glycosyltransferase [Motilibacter rhizosphaerae]
MTREPVRPLRPARRPRGPRRVAMLSVHTSPLDQPGTGDAGGLNVYVVELSRRLAALGIEVDILTRAVQEDAPPVVRLGDGVAVRHLSTGSSGPLTKEELPGQLCALSAALISAAPEGAGYDLVHSHYWLSGQVGWVAAEHWGVPLVHTMHTMARVKNLSLGPGELPEPRSREVGEAQVVGAAERLLANTGEEAEQLVELYGADPGRVAVVAPGVDLETFHPRPRAAVRARLGLPADALVLLFVGRVQPLKAPDVLVRATAELLTAYPALRSRLRTVVCGGPSGAGLAEPGALERLADELGVADVVSFQPPVPRRELADWYAAADLTVIPSRSESFGLVAIESQACGTPVVAARVGGLRTAVADGSSGVLVDGHDPQRWGRVLGELLLDPHRRLALGDGALRHAAGFSWTRTAEQVAEVYADAVTSARFSAVPGLRAVR